MRVNLIELLRDQSVAHPSRIVATTLQDGNLRIHLVGWPWWMNHADQNEERGIEFIFSDVGDGIIEPLSFASDDDEALENFSVVPSAKLEWEKLCGTEIYCNAPVPRAFELWAVVHDFLASQGTFRTTQEFFNCSDGGTLNSFLQLTRSNSYLLGRFPLAIRNLVCAELNAQEVSYTELPTTFRKPAQLLVIIGRSQFFCDRAEALFHI